MFDFLFFFARNYKIVKHVLWAIFLIFECWDWSYTFTGNMRASCCGFRFLHACGR